MGLTREKILEKKNTPPHRITDPDSGEDVFLRIMTGRERDAFEGGNYIMDAAGKVKFNSDNTRARLAAKVLSDENGERLFKDTDILTLGDLDAPFLDLVYVEGRKFNKMGDSEVKELEKNSEPGQNGDSGIDLPATSERALTSAMT